MKKRPDNLTGAIDDFKDRCKGFIHPKKNGAVFLYNSPLDKVKLRARERGISEPCLHHGYMGIIGAFGEALTQVLFGGFSPGVRNHLNKNGKNSQSGYYLSFPDHVLLHSQYPCIGEIKSNQKRFASVKFPDEQTERYRLAFVDPLNGKMNVRYYFYLHNVKDVGEVGSEPHLLRKLAEETCLLIILPFTLAYSIYNCGISRSHTDIVKRASARVRGESSSRRDEPMISSCVKARGLSKLLKDSEEFIELVGEKPEDYRISGNFLADNTNFTMKCCRRYNKGRKINLRISQFPVLEIKDTIKRRERFREDNRDLACEWLRSEIERTQGYLNEGIEPLPGEGPISEEDYEKIQESHKRYLDRLNRRLEITEIGSDELPF